MKNLLIETLLIVIYSIIPIAKDIKTVNESFISDQVRLTIINETLAIARSCSTKIFVQHKFYIKNNII